MGVGAIVAAHRGSAGSSVAAPSARWSNSPSASAAATATRHARVRGPRGRELASPRPRHAAGRLRRAGGTHRGRARHRPRLRGRVRARATDPAHRPMRTDLEVLTTLDLSDEQRAEILADLARTQGRLEATLTALERLASGELSSEKDHVDLGPDGTVRLAAEDAQRLRPDLTVTVDAPPGLVVRGCRWDCGCRSGQCDQQCRPARRRTARVDRCAPRPLSDSLRVPSRSRRRRHRRPRTRRGPRCSSASGAAAGRKGGSGLGLALVAQQPVCTAARHTSRTAPSAARDWW